MTIEIPNKGELSGFGVLDGQRIETGNSTEILAQEWGQKIEIYHIPTDTTIAFKAFLNDYSDQFQCDWNTEDVYGRMDPIVQYQGTKRSISLDWAVPAFSREEAKLNQRKCDALFRLLYPLYDTKTGVSNAMTISTAPLFRLRFGNLIVDSSNSTAAGGGGLASARESGLIGTISGFTYSPDLDQGIIFDKGGAGAGRGPTGVGLMFPKSLKLSMEYTVLHSHRPGEKAFYQGGAGASSSGGPSGRSGDNMDEADEATRRSMGVR